MTTDLNRRAQALARYQAGATSYEIAAELSVASSTVRNWVKDETGTIRRVGPRGRADVTNALIVKLRDEQRLTFTAIARRCKMSKSGVLNRYRVATEGQRRDRDPSPVSEKTASQ